MSAAEPIREEQAAPSPARGPRPLADPSDRGSLGALGERLAAEHLHGLGFFEVARNQRTRHGEIDLIACDGSTLLFAEVKTRRIGARQRDIRPDQEPLSSFRQPQRARLRRLAAAWLADEERDRPSARTIRFDAIGVVLDTDDRLRRIDHIEAAW